MAQSTIKYNLIIIQNTEHERMIFTIFISIVFIAELIITFAIIFNLIKLSKKINNLNNIIAELKSSIKDVCELIRKISEQYVEFSIDAIEKFKQNQDVYMAKLLTKALAMILIWKFNLKAINRIKKTKVYKICTKGLSLIEFMV